MVFGKSLRLYCPRDGKPLKDTGEAIIGPPAISYDNIWECPAGHEWGAYLSSEELLTMKELYV